jgi:hypothetical protein
MEILSMINLLRPKWESVILATAKKNSKPSKATPSCSSVAQLSRNLRDEVEVLKKMRDTYMSTESSCYVCGVNPKELLKRLDEIVQCAESEAPSSVKSATGGKSTSKNAALKGISSYHVGSAEELVQFHDPESFAPTAVVLERWQPIQVTPTCRQCFEVGNSDCPHIR